jgi:hypothetical protein
MIDDARMIPGAVVLVSATTFTHVAAAGDLAAMTPVPDPGLLAPTPAVATAAEKPGTPPASSRLTTGGHRPGATPAPETNLQLSFMAKPAGAIDPGHPVSRDGKESFALRARMKPAEAFALELRDESVRYLERGMFALPPDELLDDDYVLRSRGHAAEHVLTAAAEAGLGAFASGVEKHSEDRLATTGRYMGFRLDSSPSWTLRRKSARSSVRLDVPLTMTALRFRQTRELSNAHGVKRLSTGVAVDPFDEEIRFSVTLGF